MDNHKKTATSEAVYKKLKDLILHLDLPPGSFISETDTAAQYKVSRTPVRDAFKALESEGLLEIKPHIGTFVSLIDLNKISDVLYMREVLEQAVLSDLSNALTQANLLKLRLLLASQKEFLDSDLDAVSLGREFIKSDNEYHKCLFELAGKQNIWGFLETINQQYERFRTFLNLEGRSSLMLLYEEHEEILDAVSRQDQEALNSVIKRHIYGGFDRSLDVIRQHPDYFKDITV